MATSNSPVPTVPNIVSGKVLHKESRNGIGDLLVELFDLDEWADPEGGESAANGRDAASIARDPLSLISGDIANLYKLGKRAGSAATKPSGEFVIEFTARDFNLPRKAERKPDLVLLVLAPDEPGLALNKRLLHLSMDIRFNACSSEAHVILLPSALLKERGVQYGEQNEENEQTTRSRVDAYVNDKKREREFNAGVADFHGAEALRESQDRKIFRKDFIKQIATDFSAVPVRGVFAAEGDDLWDKNVQTFHDGVTKANAVLGDARAQGVPVNLYLSPKDKDRLQSFFNNPSGDFVEIPDADVQELLFRTNSTENPGALLIHNNPIASFCASESEDTKCAKQHTDILHEHEEPEVPAPPGTAIPTADTLTDAHVLGYLDRLVRDIPAPDSVLRPELAKKRKAKDVDAAVNEFSLQKGPAEVPAFYDFNSIQIAFDHVWKQLFDEAIPNLAYTANAMGKAKFGVSGLVSDAVKNGSLPLDTFKTITLEEVPPMIARFFDITKEEFNEMLPLIRKELGFIASEINECRGSTLHYGNGTFKRIGSPTLSDLRDSQLLTEQGDRLIDAVRHDDYYTLHKTLRDLHARLNGKYEFTVFAADKDYHSVNFGLMNTYRQQWTPLMYQAGKLVKTIPLSPKEERKYSVKVNRQEKRSGKEAKKNNSSITNEQHSTSRVEADIMAKAQNKMNFGHNAEFGIQVGIYSGKANHTFGVEAVSESSQNRKDFRETVLKAVQEYKDETSTEVTTESDFSSESTESGSIVNPNDELAVTYLFYELQKRYRLSEQLHRVMPVVLVAQEVPSPDQITPAWVISNDWILNRHMLDDSFRPTLRYLANNSVGDDFSLRELRKDLRQQRNLVDTLRVEFSAASMQADNRYKALESQIARRIDEEHAEATDGLIDDVVEKIGRGAVVSALIGLPGLSSLIPGAGGVGEGQDPEAAKARELAAKDAHQYALEKAEKVSAALRQEINTLHTLTDQYNKTLQARLDNETKVKRLLVHIRNNIFYYMQAIWSMEPPDQRYLRLHKVRVPVLELESRSYRVKVKTDLDIFSYFREPDTERHRAFLHGKLKHNPGGGFDTKPLVEVADLDNLLGFKGNYMVFPLKEHNALTEFMAAPYIDSAFGAMDPDELSNVNLDEYSKFVCCLHHTLDEAKFNAMKPQLLEWLEKLMATPLRNGDEIVLPTGSLFIESLVDPNPILEDFKLKHRELDVYKVQEEVRKAGLENLRFAARLLNAEREDPEIDKKIWVDRSLSPSIDVDEQ